MNWYWSCAEALEAFRASLEGQPRAAVPT